MADQTIPSTPEGSPPATIVNVVESQWRKGSCANIPVAPSGGGEFTEPFTGDFT